MSDARSRRASGPVRPGNVGPVDPTADPATDPSLRAVTPADTSGAPTVPVPTDPSGGPTVPVPTDFADRPSTPGRQPVNRTRMSGLWIGLILSALLLLMLLIFILQNLDSVQVSFLGASGTLPTGVALLFAAIGGMLLVAIPGSLRMVQLRRAARRAHEGTVR